MSLIVFAVAVLLGFATVFLARGYINEQRVRPDEAVPVKDSQDMGTLVVAAVPLSFGDEITAESLVEVPWPNDPELRPENAFSNISDVLGNTRRVAIRSISEREPVVQNKISGYGFRATLSQVVDPSKRAVAIRVNDVTGVGGFVLPGDHIDVLFTRRDRMNDELSETRMIVRNVRVLAIDQIADESTGGAVVVKAATLEVNLEQAQKLALAAKVGELDLALRPLTADGEVLDEAAVSIRPEDLVNDNSEDADPIAPKPVASVVRPRRIVPAKVAAPDPFATMTITRGVETSSTEVTRADALTDVLAGAPIVTTGTLASGNGSYPKP